MFTISQLFIYPVKSLGGIEVREANLTDRGLQYDRKWMLVDANHRFLTQREYPAMSLLQTALEGDRLKIYHKDNVADAIFVPLEPKPGATVNVTVWDDACSAQPVDAVADAWFSKQLSIPCRLVYMPDSERRMVDERYAHNQELTTFSDGYPLMMIGQASLDDLNSRLEHPLSMNRFRPNIVFTGGSAFEEDTMEHLVINGIDLFGVKLCARCVVTTIDQDNAVKAKEPLKTLATYRKKGNKIYFGQNVLAAQTGCIKAGDEIRVISNKPAALFDISG